jgi:AraC-like DNA-binding protein
MEENMRYEERLPEEKFQPYIKCFWYLEREYTELDDGEVIWPDGCQEMIFHFGSHYSINSSPLPNAFLIGTLSHYHQLKANGFIRLFGVRFLPWGLKAFMNVDSRAFQNKLIPLAELLGTEKVKELENILADSTMEQGMKEIESFLQSTFHPEDTSLAMIGILSRLYHDPMKQDVQSLAAESGYSQRQFERICSNVAGMSPKQLSKVSRFNQARLKIFRNPFIDLHECMVDFGYYDYAHFSKDFKQCLGLTPAEYKKWIMQIYDKMRKSNDVVFLQDE